MTKRQAEPSYDAPAAANAINGFCDDAVGTARRDEKIQQIENERARGFLAPE